MIDTRWHERHQRWKRNETHFTIITAQKRATHINKLTSYSGWFKKRKKRNKTKPSVFSSPSFFLFFIFARFYHERKLLIPRVVLLSDASIVGFWYNRLHAPSVIWLIALMIEDSFGAFFLRRIITGNRTIVIQCKGKAGEGVGWRLEGGGGLIEVFLNSSFSTYLKVIIMLTKSSEIQG